MNASDGMGITSLMYAAIMGDENCIYTLITLGADVKAVARTGKTALMFAKEAEHKGCVTLLQRARARCTSCCVQ